MTVTQEVRSVRMERANKASTQARQEEYMEKRALWFAQLEQARSAEFLRAQTEMFARIEQRRQALRAAFVSSIQVSEV